MKYIVRFGYAFHKNEFVDRGYGEGETFEADPDEVADQKWKLDPVRETVELPPQPVKRRRGRPPKNRSFAQPPADRGSASAGGLATGSD